MINFAIDKVKSYIYAIKLELNLGISSSGSLSILPITNGSNFFRNSFASCEKDEK